MTNGCIAEMPHERHLASAAGPFLPEWPFRANWLSTLPGLPALIAIVLLASELTLPPLSEDQRLRQLRDIA